MCHAVAIVIFAVDKKLAILQFLIIRQLQPCFCLCDVIFNGRYQRLQRIEILLRSQISTYAHFQLLAVQITVVRVENVGFLQMNKYRKLNGLVSD